jgi:hypothetical protein
MFAELDIIPVLYAGRFEARKKYHHPNVCGCTDSCCKFCTAGGNFFMFGQGPERELKAAG